MHGQGKELKYLENITVAQYNCNLEYLKVNDLSCDWNEKSKSAYGSRQNEMRSRPNRDNRTLGKIDKYKRVLLRH